MSSFLELDEHLNLNRCEFIFGDFMEHLNLNRCEFILGDFMDHLNLNRCEFILGDFMDHLNQFVGSFLGTPWKKNPVNKKAWINKNPSVNLLYFVSSFLTSV